MQHYANLVLIKDGVTPAPITSSLVLSTVKLNSYQRAIHLADHISIDALATSSLIVNLANIFRFQ